MKGTGAYVFFAVRSLEVSVVALDEMLSSGCSALARSRRASSRGRPRRSRVSSCEGRRLARLNSAKQEARVQRAEAAGLASEMTVRKAEATSSARMAVHGRDLRTAAFPLWQFRPRGSERLLSALYRRSTWDVGVTSQGSTAVP
jgi:hypothetical protein